MECRRPVTVLGLGNILLKDEGFGVRFVRWISRRRSFGGRVMLVDGGTLGYALLDIVCSSRHVIVVDAAGIDAEPGSIYRFGREEMGSFIRGASSAHEVEFAEVLCMAELMGELPGVTFLCIVPERCSGLDINMTERMSFAFPRMERLLMEELRRLGTAGSGAC